MPAKGRTSKRSCWRKCSRSSPSSVSWPSRPLSCCRRHCTPSTYTTYTNLHPLARARAYWHACHAHIHILARAPRTYFGPRAARETLPVASYTNLGGTAHPESRAAPQLRVLAHSHVLDRHRLRQGDLGLPLILTLSLTPTAAVDLTPTLTLTPALTSILTRRSSLSQRC